jgi:hypothetical protein
MKVDEILKKLEQSLDSQDRKEEILVEIKRNLEEINKREKQKEETETKAGLFVFFLFILFIIITLINIGLRMAGYGY